MSSFQFFSMTEKQAEIIIKWKYEKPYELYNMTDCQESVDELMNGDYHYVLNDQDELAGFICAGQSARVPGGYEVGLYDNNQSVDFGLGMHPELTGKGIGSSFLKSSMQFVKQQYGEKEIQLVVALFNERAIKVYERVGFTKGKTFKSPVGNLAIDFLAMKYGG